MGDCFSVPWRWELLRCMGDTSLPRILSRRPRSCRASASRVAAVFNYPQDIWTRDSPIWNTEASWGDDLYLSDPAAKAAFAVKQTMLLRAGGVERSYWYALDGSECPRCWGTLLNRDGTLNEAGVAYQLMTQWFKGAEFSERLTRQRHPNMIQTSDPHATGYSPAWPEWQHSTNDESYGLLSPLHSVIII